jgi:hypothetical protein
MPTALNRNQLLELARLGAKARLAELEEERRAIEALISSAFENKSRGRRFSTTAGRTATANESTGPRRRMSAAQRKAVSNRMKKYWASRRAAKRT